MSLAAFVGLIARETIGALCGFAADALQSGAMWSICIFIRPVLRSATALALLNPFGSYLSRQGHSSLQTQTKSPSPARRGSFSFTANSGQFFPQQVGAVELPEPRLKAPRLELLSASSAPRSQLYPCLDGTGSARGMESRSGFDAAIFR